MPHSTRNAFTLLEVLIVVLLLGLLAALTWPEFGQARRSEELDESARRMKTLVQMCRARAMNESRRYRVTFRLDGTLKVTRQRDPLLAPHEYYKFREPWANLPFLLEHVWIESVLPLPEGPPPLLVEDELTEFEEFEEEPIAVTDLERGIELNFEPDGTSSSARWVLRDEEGRAVELTLDGRLGRVQVEPVERLQLDEVERPEASPDDEDEEYEEDLEPLEERP
ncbi:MAG: prepilin-type N-terminal cleavage/methylation domain-containing protein [Phycisphaerae bacterium]